MCMWPQGWGCTHTRICALLDSHACNGRNWRHAAHHYQDQNQVKHILKPFSSLIVSNQITVNRLKFTGSKVVVMKLGTMSSCSMASVFRLGDKYCAAVLNLFCSVSTLSRLLLAWVNLPFWTYCFWQEDCPLLTPTHSPMVLKLIKDDWILKGFPFLFSSPPFLFLNVLGF